MIIITSFENSDSLILFCVLPTTLTLLPNIIFSSSRIKIILCMYILSVIKNIIILFAVILNKQLIQLLQNITLQLCHL